MWHPERASSAVHRRRSGNPKGMSPQHSSIPYSACAVTDRLRTAASSIPARAFMSTPSLVERGDVARGYSIGDSDTCVKRLHEELFRFLESGRSTPSLPVRSLPLHPFRTDLSTFRRIRPAYAQCSLITSPPTYSALPSPMGLRNNMRYVGAISAWNQREA
jgi:hypothetical protein